MIVWIQRFETLFIHLALSLSVSVEGMSVSTILVMFSVDFLVSYKNKVKISTF